jgi:hypothetical protein
MAIAVDVDGSGGAKVRPPSGRSLPSDGSRAMRLAILLLAGGVAGLAPLTAPQGAGEPPRLGFPLACEIGKTCEVQHYVDRDPGAGVLDYRCGHRSYQGHDGVDIRLLDMAEQKAGIDVLAAAAGRVARLRDGVQDISIRAPGAPSVAGQECGNGVVIDHGDGWETQYCHLARGSLKVKAGEAVAGGQPIARVGLSGDTEFPHLHITVRHLGRAVDPFAPDMSHPTACATQAGLWTPAAMRELAYKAGAVLNTGFSQGPATMEAVEAAGLPAPTTASPLVAYVRLIELEAGDAIELTLRDPQGAVLARNAVPPLASAKAQYVAFAGRRAPAGGWAHGDYAAELTVNRGGAAAITRTWRIRL